jgi:hypothetical protein
MLLVRETMFCKPGKVRPMVDKFKAMAELIRKKGMGQMRVMTDLAAERYWTVIAEFEVKSMTDFEKMMSSDSMKDFGPIMEGYHDLVERGRREIYTIEA